MSTARLPGVGGACTCQRRMCAAGFHPGNSTWGHSEGQRGVPQGRFLKKTGKVPPCRGACLRHHRSHQGCSPVLFPTRGHSRVRLLQGARSAQVGSQVLGRHSGGLSPSGKGLGATAVSRETQLVTPAPEEPMVGGSQDVKRQPGSGSCRAHRARGRLHWAAHFDTSPQGGHQSHGRGTVQSAGAPEAENTASW